VKDTSAELDTSSTSDDNEWKSVLLADV